MPNISTSNTNSIYKYSAQIVTTFPGDDSPTTIDNIRFKYIVADYNYDRFNFPLIYCYVNLTIEQQEKFVQYQKTGTLVFTLQKYIENSDMPGLKIDVIHKDFIYFISGDTGKNKERVIDENKSTDLGDDTVIGLISLDHINKLKRVVNGVVSNGTMSSIIYNVLQGHTILMEPITNNINISNLPLPPLNSITKMIKYLNNYKALYNTPYRFFMEFDITYLNSSSGKGFKLRGERCNDFKISIRHDYEERNMEGMYYDATNNMYMVECSGTYSILNDTTDSSKSFSSIGGVGASGDMSQESTGLLSSDSPIKSKVNMIRVPNNNTELIKNMSVEAANNAVTITIAKNKIDSSIITPNKHFTIDPSEVYDTKYTGDYLLSRKRELYLQEGEGMAMSTILFMKKVSG